MRESYFDFPSRAGISVDKNYQQGGYVLSRVATPPQSRQQGIAGRLMGLVLADADVEGVVLWLDISPYGEMSHADLRAWYGRLGFERQSNGRYRRLPQPVLNLIPEPDPAESATPGS